ncbi:MAG: Nramp family divalent metal transporter [Phycisphaerales bacterium]
MSTTSSKTKPGRVTRALAIISPGLVVAATGVGAGDLATAGFAGAKLGVGLVWAVALGAFLKFVLNEGLARWQLATGETILTGAMTRLGPVVSILFLIYFLPWSFVVGAALISATGVTAAAMAPDLIDDPTRAKLVFGAAHSVVGALLAWFGGFKLVERVMGVCIAVMFTAVIATAIMLEPDWGAVGLAFVRPTIPEFGSEGLDWTIALLGGVGGTLTILCYAYWMREAGRDDPERDLRICRIDLAVAYAMTALFGVAMLIIASGVEVAGSGVGLILNLADQLGEALGPAGRWVFLIGAWAAVFTSLLGVWQAVPYIFADWLAVTRYGRTRAVAIVNTAGLPYRVYLLILATVPLLQVVRPFESVQKTYAIIGAAFLPLLATVLLLLNSRTKWIGDRYRNRWPSRIILAMTILAFAIVSWRQLR